MLTSPGKYIQPKIASKGIEKIDSNTLNSKLDKKEITEIIAFGQDAVRGTILFCKVKGAIRMYQLTDFTSILSALIGPTITQINASSSGLSPAGNALNVRPVYTGTQPVSLASGSAVQVVDALVNTQKLGVDASGRITVVDAHITLDGANNAYTQTGVGAAAVQLISAGTLYKEIRIKSIAAAVNIFLGWDNLVVAGSGYELEKLGVDDEIVFYNFNANLWAIGSGAGGNTSIIARG